MAHVVVFHHACGLTTGIRSFADRLRADGHDVCTPDLYDGATFTALDAGVAHAREIGFGVLLERGRRAVAAEFPEDLPGELVTVGFSLGALPAQMLAQTRPGVAGAVLCHACVPASEFGDAWPPGVPLQVHAMEGDELFVNDGDLDAARDIVASTDDADLFLYPGTTHLFADESLPDHDESAAAVLVQRVRDFVAERSR
ncbi:dienelactone hydrolase family protein [Pseudonocardia sp. KRD291]|uniref:dienelactone hydrolase family protein n=1 Tax=Pseudonocardia sp. KRD291 TaxID=2792007 RepID=UPI001C4A5C06|nr:dienelactone hydrolase family protein [Pseudonocardia sp. KRD291]MBW0105292.1 dienelactone hydrolase family protein [Pseudonocardia sp. KRD291]